ncbi:MAG: YdeI/OmpD-associated family protein, partial [Blastocatellia bacterium]
IEDRLARYDAILDPQSSILDPLSRASEDCEMAIRFKVKLERYRDTQVLHVYLPLDIVEAFGTRARLAVKGAINGFPFRSSIFPMGGGKFYMVVNREMREGAKVKAGDTIEFVLEKDDQPRAIATPPDLLKALNGRKTAKAAWDKLNYTHRKEYISAIEEAKKPETRARRIAKTLEAIAPLSKLKVEPAKKQAAKKVAKKVAKKPAKKTAKKK